MKKGLLLLVLSFGMSYWGWGQQVIGSYPAMDGGLENQSGTLATASSINSAQVYWTTQIVTTGVISATGGRSGPKYVTYTQSGTTHRRLQTPTDNVTAASHVIQFYYQGDLDGTIAGDNIRGAASAVGTGSPAYGAYINSPNTGAVWTKYTAVVTTTGTPAFGIGIVSVNNTAQFKIDDFVLYPGSSVDIVAPSQPGTVAVNGATETSLNVSWDAASGGVDGGGYVVVRYNSDPGTGNDPNQNGIYAVGNTVTTGGTVRYIGTSTSFTDNSGLSSGTQYWYKVYTVDKAFNYSDESSGNGTTTSPSGSSSSDIIGAGNETSNIAYASYQSSSIATTSDALRLFSFTIRDGGGSADGDDLPTILASVTFDKGASNGVTNWANTLREAALFDGSTKVAEVSVTGETIIFTGLSGANVTAPDNGTKSLDLYVTFESSVTDNQQFQFQITNTNVTNASSGSSSFTTFAAVLSSVTGDANRIEVTASKLAFVQQPTNVAINTAMSPAVTVSANDANNNRDLDYITDNSVTATGATLTGSPVTSTPISGLATFSTLTFTTIGSGVTLTTTSGSLTDATSSTFNISSPPIAGEIVINQFNPGYNAATNEYIELVNKTNKTFDLSQLKIMYSSAAGSPPNSMGTLSGILEPYHFWLLSPDATISVGLTNSLARDGSFTSGMAAVSGQIAIETLANIKIDGVAYGTISSNTLGEGSPAPTPATAKDGIARAYDGIDNDNNSVDFLSVPLASIYLRNSNSLCISSTYTLPLTSYPADIVVSGSSPAVTLSENTTIAGKLSILAGELTIASSQALTVSGTLTNSAGAAGLVINSGGSLIQSSAGVEATVKRDFNAWSSNHGWHLISSPVSSQTISGAFTVVPEDEYDFYKWSEVDNLWLNQKVGANNITTFGVGTGYLAAYKTSDTKQFSGTLNKDNVPVSNLSLSGGSNYGWHLLGNPFTSALTWATGWSLTNINTTAKIWEESSASYVDIASGGIIPALNGFMVEVNTGFDGNNSLTIPTAARVHHAQSWYKSSENPTIKLLANDPAGQTAQESIIRFIPDATPGFDPDFDSHFLSGYAPLFYSRAGDENLSTNALPESGGTVQIPFDFIRNDGESFSIEAREINGIFGPVILNDLKTGAAQDLTVNSLYTFTSAAADNPDRFLLTFSHVGIGENQKNNAFTVFSANDQIVVLDNTGKNQGNVQVYSMMGQQIASAKLNGNAMLKLGLNVPTGYYLVKVIAPDAIQSSKVFIQ